MAWPIEQDIQYHFFPILEWMLVKAYNAAICKLFKNQNGKYFQWKLYSVNVYLAILLVQLYSYELSEIGHRSEEIIAYLPAQELSVHT